jgi:SulP family sulfate permease
VALPIALALGGAVGSASGALAGFYGVIAVGLFVAVFGGTAGHISGPNALMAVAMAAESRCRCIGQPNSQRCTPNGPC